MTNDILLRSHLKRLRLPVIAQNYARISKEAAANSQIFVITSNNIHHWVTCMEVNYPPAELGGIKDD